jgi:hypothetical protein
MSAENEGAEKQLDERSHPREALRQGEGGDEKSGVEGGIFPAADIEVEHELPGIWKDRCQRNRLSYAYESYNGTVDQPMNPYTSGRAANDLPRSASCAVGNLLGSRGVRGVFGCVSTIPMWLFASYVARRSYSKHSATSTILLPQGLNSTQ